MDKNVEPDDTNLDLFGLQALIALEQQGYGEPEPPIPEEDPRQMKFRFDAAML